MEMNGRSPSIPTSRSAQAGASPPRVSGERKEFHYKAFKTPKETITALSVAAQKKSMLGLDKLCVLSFLAGAYIGLGGLGSMMIAGGVTSMDKGLVKLLFAAVFPVGLMLVVVAGAELFTGNVMTMTVGVFSRKTSVVSLLRSWLISYTFNFIGSVCVAYFLGYKTNVLLPAPWESYTQNFTVAKINQPFGVQVVRGVGCNILVCLAVFMATAAEDVVSKMFAIYFPILLFVAIGFEHSVANMFYLPLGLMYNASSSFGAALWKNLLPVTIGNIIGGALVALSYFYVFSFSWPPRWKSHVDNTFVKEALWGIEVQNTE